MPLTADNILDSIRDIIKDGRKIPQDKWLSAAFSLNTLILDEIEKLEDLRLQLAKKTNEIFKREDCKSLAQAKLEVSTQDIWKSAKLQEAKVEQIKQFIQISKKNADNF